MKCLTDLRFLQKVDGRLLSRGRDKGHGWWGRKHGRCGSVGHRYDRLLSLWLVLWLRFGTFFYRGGFSGGGVITFAAVTVHHFRFGDFFGLAIRRRCRFNFAFIQDLEKKISSNLESHFHEKIMCVTSSKLNPDFFMLFNVSWKSL